MRNSIIITLGFLLCSCSSSGGTDTPDTGTTDQDPSPDQVEVEDERDLYMLAPVMANIPADPQSVAMVEGGETVYCSEGDKIGVCYSVVNQFDQLIVVGIRLTSGTDISDTRAESHSCPANSRLSSGVRMTIDDRHWGTRTYTLTVDPDNLIAEDNENNNTRQLTLTILEAGNS